jgi:AraC-like DNA-binding protein
VDPVALAPDGQQFVERRPLDVLGSHVVAVWVQQVGPDAAPYVQRSIPHGGVQVTCVLGGPVDISGPRSGPIVDELRPGSTLVGVRFEPAIGTAFDMVSPGELVDHSVAGEQVWGNAARHLADQLADQLAESSDPWSAASALEQWLVGAIDLDQSCDPIVSEFVSMCRSGATRNVTEARERLHVSERHLRRRCHESTGASPGELLRVLRFQRFVAMSQRRLAGELPPDETGLAAIAMSCGYADHAHLTRECRRLSGVTPSAFLATSREQCLCGHDHRASFERFPV